ncbi:MAG TPA: hypothetical protein VGF10_00945 [Gaiella sp.]|jgi:hypothetical protein
MSEASRPPDYISLEAHRDDDHPVEHWARWIFVAAITALAVAGLADVFGQRPSTSAADSPDATLRVQAPSALRGGLVFQARLEVVARRAIRRPTLVLSSGWFENMSFNTILPEPEQTTTEDRDVVFEYPPLQQGRTLTVYIPFQVNPTTVGRRAQGVVLRDGGRRIAAVERTVTVFP